jgi:hypothetical protein
VTGTGGHETTDPDGRVVVFDERTEAHLAIGRPQMLRHVDAILDTVSRPDLREDDPAPGRERFGAISIPNRRLPVVIGFNEPPAFVVTAFVEHHEPGRAP